MHTCQESCTQEAELHLGMIQHNTQCCVCSFESRTTPLCSTGQLYLYTMSCGVMVLFTEESGLVLETSTHALA